MPFQYKDMASGNAGTGDSREKSYHEIWLSTPAHDRADHPVDRAREAKNLDAMDNCPVEGCNGTWVRHVVQYPAGFYGEDEDGNPDPPEPFDKSFISCDNLSCELSLRYQNVSTEYLRGYEEMGIRNPQSGQQD